MRKIFYRFTILFIVTIFPVLSCSQDYDVVQKGEQVPEFTINLNDGNKINIKDYEGKIVMINFFATWCGHCLKEMPFLQKDVWERFGQNDNFKLLAIGRGHDQDEVTEFAESRNLEFPVYGDKDKSIYSKFATSYIPRNYIIDANGTIVYSFTGFNEEEFEKMVDLLSRLLTEE